MRQDVHIENDSGGFSILSSSVVDRVIEDGRENDMDFVQGHEVILMSMAGDDTPTARVVVGEPLSAAEEAEWIARVRRRLKIPCGRLILAGGFDPDCLAEARDSDWADGGLVRVVEVPPGEYLVDVYTHLPTMTARFLRKEWDEKIGEWFRREHPGGTYPLWLAGELKWSPEEDPGHEDEWRNLKASTGAGKVKIAREPFHWVGYVVHLQSLDEEAALTPPDGSGWSEMDSGLRKPDRMPAGLPATEGDGSYRGVLRDIAE
jgi:hypothetical protein